VYLITKSGFICFPIRTKSRKLDSSRLPLACSTYRSTVYMVWAADRLFSGSHVKISNLLLKPIDLLNNDAAQRKLSQEGWLRSLLITELWLYGQEFLWWWDVTLFASQNIAKSIYYTLYSLISTAKGHLWFDTPNPISSQSELTVYTNEKRFVLKALGLSCRKCFAPDPQSIISE